MDNLKGGVAAITGAGSGLGQALAVGFAKRGCNLALADVNEQGLDETMKMVADYGVKVISQKLDVADREAVYAWAETVNQAHGKVNIIINNAGVALVETVEKGTYDDLEWLMGVNYWGVIYGTKAFLPLIKASGHGSIVNISSIFGIVAVPTQSAYNAAKFAVRGFTESLIQELRMEGNDIHAMCVHPGGVKTNIVTNARSKVSMRIGSGKFTKAGDNVEANKYFQKNAFTTPTKAADTIINGVMKNKRRVLIGPDAWVVDKIQRIFPLGYQRLLEIVTKRTMPFGDKKNESNTAQPK